MRAELILAIATAAMLAAAPLSAAEVSPAVVFDMGGKFDKSFNEGVWNGMERFRKETGVEYREFEVTNETQRGADPVLGIGFAQAPALEKVAKEFPKTRFAIIDMVVDLPNVQLIVFKEHEGSLPGRRARRRDLQERQGRLHRRHGHPPYPTLRLRLRAGGQAPEPEGRGAAEHDRYDARGLEQPDQGR